MSSSSASWARSAPGSTAPVTSASPARKDGKARWYNGHTLAHINCTYGLKKNGVEHVGPAITRGALIDMVDLKGRKMKKGELITPEDIEATVKKAGVAPISEGDVVVFNTGCPGIGVAAAQYLIKKNIAMVAADT